MLKFIRGPGSYTVKSVVEIAKHCTEEFHGMYVPRRGPGSPSLFNRFYLAWKVFTGKADALFWPGRQ